MTNPKPPIEVEELIRSIYLEGVYFGRRAEASNLAKQRPKKLAQALAAVNRAYGEQMLAIEPPAGLWSKTWLAGWYTYRQAIHKQFLGGAE